MSYLFSQTRAVYEWYDLFTALLMIAIENQS